MELSPFTYETLLTSLDGLDAWLESIGVPVRPNDRIHYSLKHVRDVSPRIFGKGRPVTLDDQRRYMFNLAEVMEFQQIYQWLADENPRVLRDKIVLALTGARDPASEVARNNVGRNTMFELLLAAEWRRLGLNVLIGQPDIQLNLDNQEFIVECKRPFDWSGVLRSMKDAKKQLRVSGVSAVPGGRKGLIAVSLTRIIAGGHTWFRGLSMSDKQDLGEIMDSALIANRWRWANKITFDESIAAILFHLSLPADIGNGEHFALLSFSNAYQAGTNRDSLGLLNEQMVWRYGD